MGYTTTFTGSVTIDPPLSATEITCLRALAETRHDDRRQGQPGIWCDWVPTDDGSALVWNGVEKFYRSSDWMRYLIDTSLAPRGHVLSGSITAEGQDGAVWMIEVTNNAVSTTNVRGAMPPTYTLFVIPRGTYRAFDQEFDAAHGLIGFHPRSVRADDPGLPGMVGELLTEEPQLTVCTDGLVVATNSEYGMSIELHSDAIAFHLEVESALATGEHAFAAAQGIAERLACELGWVAIDPAQRIAVRPGKNYRSRAIALARSWMTEPDGRYMWSVV